MLVLFLGRVKRRWLTAPSLPWEIQKSELWFSFMNHAIKFRYQKRRGASISVPDRLRLRGHGGSKAGFCGFCGLEVTKGGWSEFVGLCGKFGF